MSKLCSAYTKNTNYKLKCKCKSYYNIQNKNFCYFHFTIQFSNMLLKIQSNYRRYYINKKLNNIYFKLPPEIQKKILFHVRENSLIEKHHHKVIRNILYNKVNESELKMYYNFNFMLSLLESVDETNNKLKKLIYIYNLYDKYKLIAPQEKVKILLLYRWGIFDIIEILLQYNIYDYELLSELKYILIEKFIPSYFPPI